MKYRICICIAILMLGVWLMVPLFEHPHRDPWTICRNQLTALRDALNTYDELPENLDALVRDGRIRSLPMCPAGGMSPARLAVWRALHLKVDAPSFTYRYERTGYDDFVLYCSGGHHRDVISSDDGGACSRTRFARQLSELR